MDNISGRELGFRAAKWVIVMPNKASNHRKATKGAGMCQQRPSDDQVRSKVENKGNRKLRGEIRMSFQAAYAVNVHEIAIDMRFGSMVVSEHAETYHHGERLCAFNAGIMRCMLLALQPFVVLSHAVLFWSRLHYTSKLIRILVSMVKHYVICGYKICNFEKL